MEKNSPKEKCLVLGGEGMLGHMLVSYLKTVPEFDVYFTSRNMKKGIFFDVVKNIDSLDAVIDEIKRTFGKKLEESVLEKNILLFRYGYQFAKDNIHFSY